MPATEVQATTLAKPGRKLWTREEAEKLAEIFPGERYELIEGELINKMGQKPAHAHMIRMLMRMLEAAFPDRVSAQSPIRLPDPEGRNSEPEPDIVLLHQSAQEFSQRHPGSADVALLIEVADSTLLFDRVTKLSLYARSGIQEYWVIDIPNRRTIVHRDPRGDEYALIHICEGGEPVSPLAGKGFVFRLDQTFA